ncbi:MAG: pitrilysin family protein [Bacteroidales bacterium]|nr:pitrilysin family protein [Bacteroidales bacterium]
MLDRTITPAIKPIEHFDIPTPIHKTLSNNIDLYLIDMGVTNVMRIDFMFAAGKWQQDKNLTATFVNQLLKEGAGGLSSKEIAEKLDFYGAWVQNSVTQHNSYLTFYILNKYISELLPLIELIVKLPTFPENEFLTIVERNKQLHVINQEKVDHLCLELSVNQLYGANHPYGKHASISDFEQLTTEDLHQYYNKYYHSDNCKIMLTGKLSGEAIQLIEEQFGKSIWGNPSTTADKICTTSPSLEMRSKIIKTEANQSAIRIASHTISRDHTDYHGLKVLNTIFGGYFGSRLMTSIREEKGYTYGIGSSISTQQQGSHLSISSQTGFENVDLLIDAVFDEMKKLQDAKIDSDELECARNYMLGDYARSFDGPFAIADAHISLLANHLSSDYYKKQIETIRNIDANTLQTLAQKYLNMVQYYISIAGK